MKLYLWVAMFGAIVFGMGWVTHQYTRAEQQSQVDRPDSGPSRRGRGRGGLRMVGPHIANVQEFATELELTEAQLQSFDDLVKETTEEVKRRESEIRDYLVATRGRIDDLLTTEQLERLEGLNDQRWKRYRDSIVDSWTVWLAENTETVEADREKARAALTTYMDEYSKLMREGGRRSVDSSSRVEAMTTHRDAALGQVLSAPDLERFLENGMRRSFRGDRGGRDDRRWDRRRGGRRSGMDRRGPRDGEPPAQERRAQSEENQLENSTEKPNNQLERDARGERDQEE